MERNEIEWNKLKCDETNGTKCNGNRRNEIQWNGIEKHGIAVKLNGLQWKGRKCPKAITKGNSNPPTSPARRLSVPLLSHVHTNPCICSSARIPITRILYPYPTLSTSYPSIPRSHSRADLTISQPTITDPCKVLTFTRSQYFTTPQSKTSSAARPRLCGWAAWAGGVEI